MKACFLAAVLCAIVLMVFAGIALAGSAAGAQEPKGTDVKSNVYFDKQFYSMGQRGKVIIVDKNLDKRHDAIDSYRPVKGFVFLEVNKKSASSVFIDKLFRTAFRETGQHTGVFEAAIRIPTTDDNGSTLKGKPITIRYNDIHNQIVWRDTAIVR
jgi:hypothetical protein